MDIAKVSACCNTSPRLVQLLEQKILEQQHAIESWFRQSFREAPAPFYSSVDLRNSGYKISPVDTNLFPAGFNNLNPDYLPLYVQAFQSAVERVCPEARKLLLIPENHTRNQGYLKNLLALSQFIDQAGLDTLIVSLRPDITEKTILTLDNGQTLTLHPVERRGNLLYVEGLPPCVVLLNNDFSAGVPEILQGLEQNILPPLALSWHSRLKSQHFFHYSDVAQEFAELIDCDPWLIDPLKSQCSNIDFMKREGEECLAHEVESLLGRIQQKYDHYSIEDAPFVFIKAENGTYGMGIMVAKSVDEVRQLNRKQRTKMSSLKEGLPVTKVLLQEGIPTCESIEGAVAEPVMYLVDHYVVGGFYRLHEDKGIDENLNSPGMRFVPAPFTTGCNIPNRHSPLEAEANRNYLYGVIARLAAVAAAREIAHAKAELQPLL